MSRPSCINALRKQSPLAGVLLIGALCWLALHRHREGRNIVYIDAHGTNISSPCIQRPRRVSRNFQVLSSAPRDNHPAESTLQGLHLVSSVHAIEAANMAASAGQFQEWVRLLSHYMDPGNATALHLKDGPGPLLGRLSTRSFPAVEDGPMVSVIMVASNAQSTIEYAARSILQQTWRPLELIIIDDASDDMTWSMAEELSKSDDRVKLLRNPVRVGPYVSRNRALSTVVTGVYVTTHDADDWALPRRLEVQVRHLIDGAGVTRGNFLYGMRIQETGVVSVGPPSPSSPDGVSRQAFPSAMYETVLLREHLGHWDSVLFEADNEMMYRARAFLGAGFVEIAHVGILLADRPGSLGKQGHSKTTSDPRGPVSSRTAYRQAYFDWHEKAQRSGRGLYLDFPQYDRIFPAPKEMAIKLDKVCACLEGTRNACKKLA